LSGVGTLVTSARRSAIEAQREASGASRRRIIVERKRPSRDPQLARP
jgi:hypothetical protein